MWKNLTGRNTVCQLPELLHDCRPSLIAQRALVTGGDAQEGGRHNAPWVAHTFGHVMHLPSNARAKMMKLTLQTQGNKMPDVLMHVSVVICAEQLLKSSSFFKPFACLSSALQGVCGLDNSVCVPTID